MIERGNDSREEGRVERGDDTISRIANEPLWSRERREQGDGEVGTRPEFR